MRPGLLASVALLASIPVFLGAQEPKDQRHTVTMEGCVQKSWLKVLEEGPTAFGQSSDRYHLHGTKDLMKTLTKDLNGHRVEVTGLLSDPDGSQGRGKEIQIGKKTRIYTNARDKSTIPPPVDPTIEVSSFRDLSPTCAR